MTNDNDCSPDYLALMGGVHAATLREWRQLDQRHWVLVDSSGKVIARVTQLVGGLYCANGCDEFFDLESAKKAARKGAAP